MNTTSRDILLVEDNAADARLVSIALSEHGVESRRGEGSTFFVRLPSSDRTPGVSRTASRGRGMSR